MKIAQAYALITLVLMISTNIYSQDGMVCKDGVCTFNPKTTVTEINQEPKAEFNEIIELTQENFDAVINNKDKTVIVDFYASWCQPCKFMKPIFEELARQETGYIFAAIDGDKNRALSSRTGVNAFPTFVVFKGGVQWGKIEGGRPKDQLMAEFKRIDAQPQPTGASQADRLMELLMAISERNVEAVKKSLATGVDLNQTLETPQGSLAPLTIAVISGTTEIIDLLISSGATLDITLAESIKNQIIASEEMTADLQKSFDYCKNKIASLPAPVIQNCTKSCPDLGIEFLKVMANKDELKKLIDQGADVNVVFPIGKSYSTPLCFAMLMKNKEAMDTLIEAGASLVIEIVNEKGNKQTLHDSIQNDIETYRLGNKASRERLAYAVSKTKV